MNTLTTWLELISGIFIAAEFFLPNNLGEQIGRFIATNLPSIHDIKNPLNIRTIIFNTIMTFFVLLLVILWAMAKDTAEYSTIERLTSFGLFVLGIVVGSIIINVIFYVLRNIGNLISYTYSRINQTEYHESDNILVLNILWIISFFIMYFSLLYAARLANNGLTMAMTPTSTFVLSVMILPMFMVSAPTIKNFLDATPDKRVYVIARIGIVLFISAKVMILTAIL